YQSTALIFFFNAPSTTAIYTLSLHDALPISRLNNSLRDVPAHFLFQLSQLRRQAHSDVIIRHLTDLSRFDKIVQAVKWKENVRIDRKSTRLNSSHVKISYAVFCLKKKKKQKK